MESPDEKQALAGVPNWPQTLRIFAQEEVSYPTTLGPTVFRYVKRSETPYLQLFLDGEVSICVGSYEMVLCACAIKIVLTCGHHDSGCGFM